MSRPNLPTAAAFGMLAFSILVGSFIAFVVLAFGCTDRDGIDACDIKKPHIDTTGNWLACNCDCDCPDNVPDCWGDESSSDDGAP